MNSAAPDEAADFDKLFAAEEATPSPAVQSEATPAAPTPVATAAEAAQEPAATSPAAQEAQPQAPATAAAPEAQAPADDDWVAALPAEVQEKIKAERTAAETKYNALHGKVAPLQRQLSRLQTPQSAAPVASTPATPQQPVATPAAVEGDYFETDAWKNYEKDFPGDAKVMRGLIERQQAAANKEIGNLTERLQRIETNLAGTNRSLAERTLDEQIKALDSQHPDWRDINDSDEFWQFFEDWRLSQPNEVQHVYYDKDSLNRLFTDAEFVGKRLTEFKAQRQAGSGAAPPAAPAAQQDQPHPQTPVAQQPVANGAAARLAMAASPTIKGGAQVPRGVPLESMTEAQQFDHLFAAEQAQ